MMNRKICFVGTELTPSEGSTFVGGHVNTVVCLCKGLADLGWEVHIVTTPSRFLRNKTFSFPWAEFHLIHASGHYNSINYDIDYMAKAVKTVKALYHEQHIELVHGHSGYFGSSIIPVLAKKSVNIPALFSLYCPASLLPCKLPMNSYGVKVLSYGLDKIIAVTSNVRDSLTKCGVKSEKIDVLHSCYDERAFNVVASYMERNKTCSENSKQSVLFVGNADKTKGLDIFIAAARAVLHTNPEIKFLITLHESVERLESLRDHVSHSLGSSAEVLGVVENMAKLMTSVDVVVTPFRSTEGISDIPIVVLEAMALGKPVIASNLNGIKEAIQNGENGLIVDINNPNELANAISNVLNNSVLKNELSYKALDSVQKFSYSEISKRLSNIYIKVMERA
jgi:glycosyltransferase involved in cell wall biosynthesis